MIKAERADIVHSHGLWLMPNVYAGYAAARSNKPLFVSAHGMLSQQALQYSSLLKRAFWVLCQQPAYSKTAVWHATSLAEAKAIRQYGISAPIAVVPNGTDIPQEVASHIITKARRTLLFLSRLHPHKGLNSLIDAWSVVAPQRPNWDLVVAGYADSKYKKELIAYADLMRARPIYFPGHVTGADKDALFLNADLFVLPSKSENFGLVVAEALAAGVPAIVTKGAPWERLKYEGCGWWIDQGPEALADTLLEATALSASQRKHMGQLGRMWMSREFGWDFIAARMINLYEWTLGRHGSPDFIY